MYTGPVGAQGSAYMGGYNVMQTSKAYEEFVKLTKSFDLRKAELYSLDVFDRVYDFEIEKLEDLIWDTFHKEHDTGLLIFFPKLKKYDGISALKKLVNEYKIPSGVHMLISSLIYDNTKEIYYLKLMEKNIVESQYKFSYIAGMIHSKPCEDVYQALVRVYMNCSEEIALSTCISGILYNRGFISDLNDFHQIVNIKELSKLIQNAPFDERRKVIEKLEKGEFDKYKER